MSGVDAITLNFSPAAVLALQCVLALVIFGVALELSWADFKRLMQQPKAVFVGLLSQLVVLPLLTFGLIYVTQPPPSLALGLMMTAACPGGNMSNVLTHWSGGRTSVSMTLTTLSSLISPITTPLSFALLAGLTPATAAALKTVAVPVSELVGTILLALVVPLALGMWLKSSQPVFASGIEKPLKRFGVLVFVAFVALAVAANGKLFMQAMGAIFVLVSAHNALALGTGFAIASAFKVNRAERKAITFETGIHNTALGLTLTFSFYQGLGGMALVLAWWGVWHLITGGILARYWARQQPDK